MMQFRGSIPCSQLAASSCSSSAARHHLQQQQQCSSIDTSSSNSAAGRRRLLLQRFAELADEVAEREAFVSSMQQLKKLSTEHVNIVKREVAEKVQEMKQLDEQTRLLDRQSKVDAQQ
jgi:hypothetical protein